MVWQFFTKRARTPRSTSSPSPRRQRRILELEVLENRLAPAVVSGTVFEDVNYGGGAGRSLAASAGVARPGATVELYNAAGDFLESTTTNLLGNYRFTGLTANSNFFIRVVNSTVTSARPGATAALLPVQTFRTSIVDRTAIPVTDRIGGAVPSQQDSGPKGLGGNLNDAAIEQSVTLVQLVVVDNLDTITGTDFGFNFDTIVNTNNSGQGSLRQFLLNSNALTNTGLAQVGQTAGVEASIFMIPSAADPFGRPVDPNFSDGRAVIAQTSALPVVTDANTHIDGASQTANIGDTNAGTLGAGGTVGVDALPLPTVPRPEVELRNGASVALGLTIDALDAAVRGLAVFGFGSANVFLAANGDGAVIEQNVVGSGATAFADPGSAARTFGDNIRGIDASDVVVRDNLIGFAADHGVWPQFATGWLIEGNEVRSNALVFEAYDGIEVNNSTATVVQGNLIVDSGGNGVDLLTASNTTVANNTVIGNGRGDEETAGIAIRRIDSTNNTISGNVVAANVGPGVLVTDSSVGNIISRNSTFANRGLGIDLALSGTIGDGVTLNDSGDADSGSNGLLNFPVLVNATVNGSTLALTGFARPGSVIELFIADPDPRNFGEGKTYLVTLTEGSAADLDGATGSYGPGPVNGIVQGSDTTNRFRFDVPLASLLAPVGIGTVLTATATLANSTSEFSGNVTVIAANPTLTTSPSPVTVALGTAPVTLTDSATLADGFNPTGTITFTLVAPGGATVDTETVTVNGNGIYTTPTGFNLPSTGTAIGAYQWNAVYSGDANNSSLSDINDPTERVTVSAASPALGTITIPLLGGTLGSTPVTLNDVAQLENGFHPTGTITFTLFHNGGSTPVDTETVTVNGNGAYTTPTGFTLPSTGSVTGTYQWNATYSGDSNNSSVSDNDAAAERVTIFAASPTLSTAPNLGTVTLGATAPPILTDSAFLAGGFNPTGTITFTLFYNGDSTPVDTETVTVNGNGIYTTPTGFTLPTTGAAAGTYQWVAVYSGDSNNAAANDQGGISEQVTVSAASPTLATTPSPNTLAAGVTLNDTAFLVGGFHPTGAITFTLFFNGGSTPVDTETVTVNGNGAYTTPTGFVPGTASGTYQWNATYSGDANNNTASDVNNPTEQVTVIVPALTLSTAPTPATVTLGTTPVTLNDTADLEGGLNPSGTITFTLFYNGGSTPVDTETVTVNGAGVYTTPTGFTLPGTGGVTGTYQWNTTYSGDANNGPLSDDNDPTERVLVIAGRPGLATIPIPDTVKLGATPVTLNDAAQLIYGFNPTGTITFTLVAPGGGTVDTETVTVNGNGIYRTPTGFTLPSTGSVTGIYQWAATYSGDANNNPASDSSDDFPERVTVSASQPALGTIPIPDAVTLGATPVTLNDAAQLVNGFNPTGTITFTLFYNGGSTPLDTETVIVNGNGIYTTPTGFTLPSSGPATGTYQWVAVYSGDANNNPASDIDPTTEQVTVSAANPTLITTPTPNTVTLGTSPVTLTDSATLANGFNPMGTITFMLTGPGGFSYTQMDTVSGNGIYIAQTTLPTTGTVAGAYQWVAVYGGDTNNNSASDNDPVAERVTVSAASPTLMTTPNPDTVILGATAPPILTDSASLAGGFNPTGTITFTLVAPGGATVDTETVTVNGNGVYSTPTGFSLPSGATVTGTYQWNASYSGDVNNNADSDVNAADEQVTISPASPTIVTTPNPTTVTLGGTLQDTAVLADGFDPTGSITFRLYAPGVDPTVGPAIYTETVLVNGNDIYSTTAGFVSNAAGVWHWGAIYTGDANNNLVSSGPLDEPVTVELASNGSISGSVYLDKNNNGVRNRNEKGIAGVLILLSGTDATGKQVVLWTTTDAQGNYRFTGLLPGTYSLFERQPRRFADGRDRAGSRGGTAGNDRITGIRLGANEAAIAYVFGEMTITKRLLLASTAATLMRAMSRR